MKKWILGIVILAFLTGCASVGSFPHTSATTVDLTRNNYRIVKSNAIGESHGFRLLGLIPFASPTYTGAMSDLYSKAGVAEGKAQALANVTQEQSSIYLILFSIPKVTVRADIVEFIDEKNNG